MMSLTRPQKPAALGYTKQTPTQGPATGWTGATPASGIGSSAWTGTPSYSAPADMGKNYGQNPVFSKNWTPGTGPLGWKTGGGAPDPGKGSDYSHPDRSPPPPPPPSPYGSQSGPGILESWFNQRANGTDPGYEYAMNRGMNDIDSRMAAGGSYNSGARGQQLGDFAANMSAQREAQLDALAGGASGEHMGRLAQMFGQGGALAQGQATAGTAYDTAAAGNMAAASQAQQQMYLNSAAQQQGQRQGMVNNLMSMYGLSRMGGGSGGGGGGYYDPNGLMSPSF